MTDPLRLVINYVEEHTPVYWGDECFSYKASPDGGEEDYIVLCKEELAHLAAEVGASIILVGAYALAHEWGHLQDVQFEAGQQEELRAWTHAKAILNQLEVPMDFYEEVKMYCLVSHL